MSRVYYKRYWRLWKSRFGKHHSAALQVVSFVPKTVDEATVRRHPTLTAPWSLGDDIPEVPTGDDHTTGHGYGAVAPLTGHPPSHRGAVLDTGEFPVFLRHLLTDYRDKRLLVIPETGRGSIKGLLSRHSGVRWGNGSC
jgi:hypothetical protein